MNITLQSLDQLLSLVGKLDDSSGEDTPRERFRKFLKDNVTEVGQVRDYINDCLRSSGQQYNRALQDLVNHLGNFLGFEVSYGRYQGTQGGIGFDGLWKSPTGFDIVVEVKTSEVYAIKTTTLIGYVNDLIHEKQIGSWSKALGLYVIGKPDPELQQLENAIAADKGTHQLRIISVDSLLSLAEMMSEYDIEHASILNLIRPSGPTVDSIVELMERLVNPSDSPFSDDGTGSDGGGGDDPQPKYKGTKPAAFTLCGIRHEVTQWKDILMQVCGSMLEQHPNRKQRLLTIKGKKRSYFSTRKEDLTKYGKEIPGTDIFAETNFSAEAIVRLAGLVVETFDYDPKADFSVEIRADS